MLRAITAVAAAVVLGLLVHSHTPAFDIAALRHLSAHGRAVDVWKAVTELGSVPVLAAGIAGAALVSRPRRRDLLLLAVALLAAYLLAHAGKALFDRPRPPLAFRRASASGSSYPSGHAAQAAAVYGTAALLWFRRWAGILVVAAALVVLVAVSRVALGVHYPTDVIGGVVVGFGVVSAAGVAAPLRTKALRRRLRR